MTTLTFRFYGSLNDFLPAARKHATLVCEYSGRVAVKDAIESLGVPHPEIDLVIANGTPVSFAYIVEPGDRISAYPLFEHLDVPADLRLVPPTDRPSFAADAHLGRLAAYLRLLGFDTAYRNDFADDELAAISAREQRIVLTRDLGVLKRSAVARGYFLRNTEPGRQLTEVARRYGLRRHSRPFSRCLRCNTPLTPESKERVAPFVPPRSRERFEEFSRCVTCGRVYWKGSHYERMARLVDAVLKSGSG